MASALLEEEGPSSPADTSRYQESRRRLLLLRHPRRPEELHVHALGSHGLPPPPPDDRPRRAVRRPRRGVGCGRPRLALRRRVRGPRQRGCPRHPDARGHRPVDPRRRRGLRARRAHRRRPRLPPCGGRQSGRAARRARQVRGDVLVDRRRAAGLLRPAPHLRLAGARRWQRHRARSRLHRDPRPAGGRRVRGHPRRPRGGLLRRQRAGRQGHQARRAGLDAPRAHPLHPHLRQRRGRVAPAARRRAGGPRGVRHGPLPHLGHRRLDLLPEHHHAARARAGHRLRPVRRDPVPRGARPARRRRGRRGRHGGDRRPHDRLVGAHGRPVPRLAAHVPAGVPAVDGDRRRGRGRRRDDRRADGAAGRARGAGSPGRLLAAAPPPVASLPRAPGRRPGAGQRLGELRPPGDATARWSSSPLRSWSSSRSVRRSSAPRSAGSTSGRSRPRPRAASRARRSPPSSPEAAPPSPRSSRRGWTSSSSAASPPRPGRSRG